MSTNGTWQEHDIARALELFQPQPSAQFYERIQGKPWMQEPVATLAAAPRRGTFTRRWIPAAGLLVMLLVAGVVFVTPPLRALAQEVLHLITRERTNVVPQQQWDVDRSLFETMQRDLTLAQAEQLAGFDVWVPSNLPEAYRLQRVGYLPTVHIVMTMYSTDDNFVLESDELPWLTLIQEPAANAATLDMVRVGSTAPIETVQIGDVKGQYVSGSWMLFQDSGYWIGDDSHRILRWQQGEQVFTLEVSGDSNAFSREQMIELAAHIAPSAED
jgi:hypothetical protein